VKQAERMLKRNAGAYAEHPAALEAGLAPYHLRLMHFLGYLET
jgi:hypothetical protein